MPRNASAAAPRSSQSAGICPGGAPFDAIADRSSSAPHSQRPAQGFPITTASMRAPAIRPAKLRRVTSTSGSSGMDLKILPLNKGLANALQWGSLSGQGRSVGRKLQLSWSDEEKNLALLLLALDGGSLGAGTASTPIHCARHTFEPDAGQGCAGIRTVIGARQQPVLRSAGRRDHGAGSEPSIGFSLLLDAARKTGDVQLLPARDRNCIAGTFRRCGYATNSLAWKKECTGVPRCKPLCAADTDCLNPHWRHAATAEN